MNPPFCSGAAGGVYTLRLKFPAGYRFPSHWHPKTEHLTVLSGSFQLGMGTSEDQSMEKTYGPGDFLMIPGRHPHYGGAAQESVVQLHGVGPFQINFKPHEATWKELVDDSKMVIGGSPATVAHQLEEAARNIRVGHMMVLMQFGDMPKDKAMRSTELFAREVMPALRDTWSEWTDHWYPSGAGLVAG